MANDNQTEQKGRKNRGFHKPEDDIEIILEDKQNRQKDREMWRNKRRKGDDILDLDDMVNGFNKKTLEDDFVENFETLKDKKGKKDNKKMEQMQKKIRESIKEKEEERLNKKMQLSEKREKRRIQREELKKQIEKAQEQGIFDDELQNKFLDQEKEIEKQEMEDQMEERKIYEEQSNEEMKILKEQAEEMVRHGGSHPMDFLLEWEEQLGDFSPDEMLSFEINGKEQEIFLEEITKPSLIRGVYYSNQNDNQNIDFQVLGPNKEQLVTRNDKKGIFTVDIDDNAELGTYTFVFHNKNKKKIHISFAIDVSDNENFLQTQDILDLEGAIRKTNQRLKGERKQFKYYQRITKDMQAKQNWNHKKYFIATIVETILILVLTFVQVISIKRLLANNCIV